MDGDTLVVDTSGFNDDEFILPGSRPHSDALHNDRSGRVICAIRGTDSALYGIRFDPRTAFAANLQYLGGVLVGDPSRATADDGAGYITCAARGGSNALYGIQLDPRIKYSSGYQNLGGVLVRGSKLWKSERRIRTGYLRGCRRR
jgi:hypothetical protein